MIKKSIISVLIAIMLICTITLNVNAANETDVILSPSNVEVNPGETFTITIKGICGEGINGIESTVTYDKDKLELVDSKVADNNWINMGQTTNGKIDIAVMSNSTSTITDANIFILTFKAKDNVQRGTELTINASNVFLYDDASQKCSVGNKTVQVLIKENTTNETDSGESTNTMPESNPQVEPKQETQPEQTPTNEDTPKQEAPNESNEPKGESPKQEAQPEQTPTNEDTPKQEKPNESNETKGESPKQETQSEKNNVQKPATDDKENTQYKEKIPQTGEMSYVIMAVLVAILIISIISYIKLKKYNV